MRRLFPLMLLASLLPALGSCTVSRQAVTPAGQNAQALPTVVGRTVTVGQDVQLEVSLDGRLAAAQALRWHSDRPQVAAVSASGVVTALAAGTATVRATLVRSGQLLAEFRLTVSEPPPAVSQRLDTVTAQVLALTNAARARGQTCGREAFPPAPPLVSEARLGAAAQAHAADMAARAYFSHVSQDGRALGDRVDGTGYVWRAVAENIAAGQMDAPEVVAGWLQSEGHCRNLMNAEYRELGLGLAQSQSGKHYWVQDFGRR